MGITLVTAGESHGPAVLAVLEGVPAGLAVVSSRIDAELERRQRGHGRGPRMAIESDRVRILSGVRQGRAIGSPITLLVENRDYENWLSVMAADAPGDGLPRPETRPRPGHGDLAGMLKHGAADARDILERASARETAARVAAGAVAGELLAVAGIRVMSRVVAIGDVRCEILTQVGISGFEAAEEHELGCPEPGCSRRMVQAIDRAAESGDSLGGVFEVAAFGMIPGLGSHVSHSKRLDARLTAAVMSIPAVRGVEVGDGFALASRPGSLAHDEISFSPERKLHRETNRAGGLEAGMTNGEDVLIRAAMKPIPSLGRPLATVDLETLEAAEAFKERADVCAVPAAAVVGKAMVALTLADALVEKFGGDSVRELKRNLRGYLEDISELWDGGGSRA